jgi:hypothetical protein
VAKRLHETIMSKGNTIDPVDQFRPSAAAT